MSAAFAPAAPAASTATALSLQGIGVRFGGLQALDDVSFDVPQGQAIGILGPNGAGKTTLFNVITGFVPRHTGVVRAFDSDLTELRPDQRSRLGVVRTFQNLQVFEHMTVFENVLVGFHGRTGSGVMSDAFRLRRARRESGWTRNEAAELLELVGIAEYAGSYPADVPFGVLRRLDIARALAAAPKLLLLDEPASGLHLSERLELRQVIEAVHQAHDLTVIVVEHDVELVMALCSFVHVLEFGRLIFSGTPEEVDRSEVVQAAYLGVDHA
ncbi:MAG: ATP-binding cassette domain-containing protein [Actinomycetota bacterium]